MRLLSLKSGRLSLEFVPQELPLVRSRLAVAARKGRVPARIVQQPGGTHDVVSVRGMEFILLSELGEHALISTSLTGDILLRRVARDVGRTAIRARRRQFRRELIQQAA